MMRRGQVVDSASPHPALAVQETQLREKVKAAGGRWDPEKRVWHLPMEQVLQLGLTARVMTPDQTTPTTIGGNQVQADV